MSDENQLLIPPSFIDLFVPPGRIKPHASRQTIADRYELCEDLATALVERAKTVLWDLGVTEWDVLERIHRGLLADTSGLTPAEAVWVTRRLAELVEWSCPQLARLGQV